ncbi:MAG TPA: helix-turn-helix transcriptional regulator [Verrucomicrobiae bacterium]|nr:helix-turn-helix transcriptional regulator [Verrucomicrobiae bacterium]
MLSDHVDKVSSHVARILREEREKRGLSMTLLAERSGLSHSMISFIEREIRNPSLETLLRIAFVLKLDLAEIIQRAETAARKPK